MCHFSNNAGFALKFPQLRAKKLFVNFGSKKIHIIKIHGSVKKRLTFEINHVTLLQFREKS